MFGKIYGVDFSGAKQAGRNLWLARIEPRGDSGKATYRLTQLASLEMLCGTADRTPALAHLARMIACSEGALWGLGFPFGFPIEVMSPDASWAEQFAFLADWGEDAYGAGVECLRRAQALGGPGHIRRLTDVETKAPWDTYAYRLIYQTFYGMRDVLGPLRAREDRAVYGAGGGTAVLPFDYERLPAARRVVVEACPASTLKRLGLPHQNYKYLGSGPLPAKCRAARRVILAGLAEHVSVGRVRRQTLMRNPGGDALDALIAAVGAAWAWDATDHGAVARHPRYVREGRHYAYGDAPGRFNETPLRYPCLMNDEKTLDAVPDPKTAQGDEGIADTAIPPPGREQDEREETLSLGEDVPGIGLPPAGGFTDRRVDAQIDGLPDPDDGPPAPPEIS